MQCDDYHSVGQALDIFIYSVAFQANGRLWVDGAPTGLGMRAGTSPTVSPSGAVMFQANTGELWSLGGSLGLGMAANTSPANRDHVRC